MPSDKANVQPRFEAQEWVVGKWAVVVLHPRGKRTWVWYADEADACGLAEALNNAVANAEIAKAAKNLAAMLHDFKTWEADINKHDSKLHVLGRLDRLDSLYAALVVYDRTALKESKNV